jgi:ribosome assembly protein RRB1
MKAATAMESDDEDLKPKVSTIITPSIIKTVNTVNLKRFSHPSSQRSHIQVWIPGRDALEEGETLDYDPTAYDCMASMSLEWPALSFDIIKDNLGAPRSTFPLSFFMVAGTQAATSRNNYLAVMRVSNLTQGKHGLQKIDKAKINKTKKNNNNDSNDDTMDVSDDEEDSDSDSDDDDEEEASLHVRKVAHTGGINRIRSMPQSPHIIASWSDTAQVQILDLHALLQEVADEPDEDNNDNVGTGAGPSSSGGGGNQNNKINKVPALQVHSHSSEGYALDWSPVVQGQLASGDCRSKIHIWTPSPGGKWQVGAGLKGHTASVEDIQWSPSEPTVFASCSVDKTIRVWDSRSKSGAMITVENAHASDVNVISWNHGTSYMLASGGDDGVLRVWDLRSFSPSGPSGTTDSTVVANPQPVADFSYHKKPITSVEWCPNEPSMLLTTGEDHQLALWDLALERDPEEEAALGAGTAAVMTGEVEEALPAQLLFVHAGQMNPKEGHWHPQIPGLIVSTAADGFNIFKPSNI